MCVLCAGGDGNLLRAKDPSRKRQHRLRWLLPDQLQPLHVCANFPRPSSRSSNSICVMLCGTGKLEDSGAMSGCCTLKRALSHWHYSERNPLQVQQQTRGVVPGR